MININFSIEIDGVKQVQNNSNLDFKIENASTIYAVKRLTQVIDFLLYKELMIELKDQPEPDYGEEVMD